MNVPDKSHPTLTRIALTGFMAAGKSTVGAEFARSLSSAFVDLDNFIQVSDGRAIAHIIREEGEQRFRALETELLKETLIAHESSPRVVLALGGGTWTLERNREQLRALNFLTVWLDAPFALCWRRIENSLLSVPLSTSPRPLAPDVEAARRLYDERQNIYRLADARVQIDEDRSVREIVAEIIRQANYGERA